MSRAAAPAITPEGLYEFNVTLIDQSSAPATIQRLMQRVLVGLGGDQGFCSVFIDDILVCSDSEAEQVTL